MTTSRDFTGKVVLITGSGGGIGAVTAVEFARLGARVVVTDFRKDRVSVVAKQCAEASPTGDKALEVVADVTNDDDCRRLVADTIKTFKKLDILVNNAGRGIVSSIWDGDILDKYELIMNTNLRSVVWLTHLCVEHLEKTKGNIVNVSSIAALKPKQLSYLYSMSKAALDMFTKCVALELGPKGIRANIINPGPVKSEFVEISRNVTKEKSDELFAERAKICPIGRVGEPLDVAKAVLYLTSDEASFVTGSNFVVDGGVQYV
ncbi:unnamed protein product [Oppiella nova]|uniref:Uncharacterized protein n=1 Tax=Oppiella nova TaxID=334625 RepID=A0A7R9QID2_9ACAR|nr:unnamed protein product [Oppiella nova]CAG2165947.1 unnamed protein product [Oppiella nova]